MTAPIPCGSSNAGGFTMSFDQRDLQTRLMAGICFVSQWSSIPLIINAKFQRSLADACDSVALRHRQTSVERGHRPTNANPAPRVYLSEL
jgi:hypothetical protein